MTATTLESPVQDSQPQKSDSIIYLFEPSGRDDYNKGKIEFLGVELPKKGQPKKVRRFSIFRGVHRMSRENWEWLQTHEPAQRYLKQGRLVMVVDGFHLFRDAVTVAGTSKPISVEAIIENTFEPELLEDWISYGQNLDRESLSKIGTWMDSARKQLEALTKPTETNRVEMPRYSDTMPGASGTRAGVL